MKTVELSTCRIAVEDRGNGIPILFVHGFPLDHTMWDAQIEYFSSQGDYRVIAPDLCGFGQSRFRGEPPAKISMQAFADELAEVLDQLQVESPVIYCGLSMGGYIGWQFLRYHASRIQGLIMCDTRAGADSEEIARGRRFVADGVVEAGTKVALRGMVDRLVSPQTKAAKPELVHRLEQSIEAASPYAVAAAQRGMADRPDSSALLRLIDVPTLLLCGRDDKITPPEEMQLMADQIAESQFEVIPDSGHLPPMENPDATNQAIERFLRRFRKE